MAQARKPVDFSLLAVEKWTPTKNELTPKLGALDRWWLNVSQGALGREQAKMPRLLDRYRLPTLGHEYFKVLDSPVVREQLRVRVTRYEWLARHRLPDCDRPVEPLLLPRHRPHRLQVEIVFPKPASSRHQHQAEIRSPKSLIGAEVRRRAAAGERYDSITKLSLILHEWMKTVSDRPLKPRTIENYLRAGGLWLPLFKK